MPLYLINPSSQINVICTWKHEMNPTGHININKTLKQVSMYQDFRNNIKLFYYRNKSVCYTVVYTVIWWMNHPISCFYWHFKDVVKAPLNIASAESGFYVMCDFAMNALMLSIVFPSGPCYINRLTSWQN